MTNCQKRITKMAIGVTGLTALTYAIIEHQPLITTLPFHMAIIGAGAILFGYFLATGFYTPDNFACE